MKLSNFVLFFSLICLVIFRYFTTLPVYRDGQKLRISAKVLTDPVKYSAYQSVRLLRLTVYLPAYPEVHYGDWVVVEGVIEGGKIKRGVLVERRDSAGPVVSFRKQIIDYYNRILPQPHAGLVAGVVLGAKAGFTDVFWQKLKKAGVAHVVVASGMNVTFVAFFLLSCFTLFLPRRKSIPFVVVGIVLYLFISGFDAPLVRAAVMGTVVFLAQEMGRLVSAWRALILSAAAMLIVNPDWLVDIGFILSFVATASLLVFQKKIESKLKFIPGVIREGFSTSLAAQIGVAPILFVTFGQFNLLSPFINALVLWTIPAIMIFGAIGGVLGLAVPLLGKLILYLSYPLTWWFTSIVTLFGS